MQHIFVRKLLADELNAQMDMTSEYSINDVRIEW